MRGVTTNVARAVRATCIHAHLFDRTTFVARGDEFSRGPGPELAVSGRIRPVTEEGPPCAPVEVLGIEEDDYTRDIRSLTQQPRHGAFRSRAGKIEESVLQCPARRQDPDRAPSQVC